MNDWLDYKGSGSYRAYANDELTHDFFNTKAKIEAKQSEADLRLYLAEQEKLRKLESIALSEKQKYEDALKEYGFWSDEYKASRDMAEGYENARKKAAQTSPLWATQKFESEISRAKTRMTIAEENRDKWYKEYNKFYDSWQDADDKAKKYRNQLNKKKIKDDISFSHAFNFREKIDTGIKAIGDVVTLPSKTDALAKQLKAYADLISAKRELYNSLVAKANRSDNERQHERYKREAEKVKSDINKIKKDVESDISRYQKNIKDNEILGPIIKSIENSAKALPSVMSMTFETAATNLRSRW